MGDELGWNGAPKSSSALGPVQFCLMLRINLSLSSEKILTFLSVLFQNLSNIPNSVFNYNRPNMFSHILAPDYYYYYYYTDLLNSKHQAVGFTA